MNNTVHFPYNCLFVIFYNVNPVRSDLTVLLHSIYPGVAFLSDPLIDYTNGLFCKFIHSSSFLRKGPIYVIFVFLIIMVAFAKLLRYVIVSSYIHAISSYKHQSYNFWKLRTTITKQRSYTR